MTITARNIGRINVWPTYDIAREADTAECEFVGQLTVWRTADEARANMTHEGGGAPGWVPANAIAAWDFENDQYWSETDGEQNLAYFGADFAMSVNGAAEGTHSGTDTAVVNAVVFHQRGEPDWQPNMLTIYPPDTDLQDLSEG